MKTIFTKPEWREVARLARPDWTDQEFDGKWKEFQDLKSAGLLGGGSVRVG